MESEHGTILMRWIIDLNSGIDHFASKCQTNHILALQAQIFNMRGNMLHD
jgi:hypothetical protein